MIATEWSRFGAIRESCAVGVWFLKIVPTAIKFEEVAARFTCKDVRTEKQGDQSILESAETGADFITHTTLGCTYTSGWAQA